MACRSRACEGTQVTRADFDESPGKWNLEKVRVTLSEEFPRVFVNRKRQKIGRNGGIENHTASGSL